MMDAAWTSETLVNFYQTTRCYKPEDSHLHTHRRENLKSYFEICLFRNPFAVDINEFAAQMQMKVVELQSNDSLKDAFSAGNLLQFYARLPILNFPTIKNFAKKMITAFGST
jgi:hypothetical protein